MSFDVFTQSPAGAKLPHGRFATVHEAQSRAARRIAFVQSYGAPVEQIDSTSWSIGKPDFPPLEADLVGVLQIRSVNADIN